MFPFWRQNLIIDFSYFEVRWIIESILFLISCGQKLSTLGLSSFQDDIANWIQDFWMLEWRKIHTHTQAFLYFSSLYQVWIRNLWYISFTVSFFGGGVAWIWNSASPLCQKHIALGSQFRENNNFSSCVPEVSRLYSY